MKYLEKREMNSFLEFLKKNNHQMKSSSEEEIEQLKQIINNKKLPDSYLMFMENAGNGIRFFRGSSYCMSEIRQLKKWAIELLQEDNSAEILTDNDFVFFMHQGYQFYFFKLDEGIDPPVYYYEEGENSHKFIKKFDSLSDFFIEHYNEVESLIKD